jgi:hypothetical protein
VVGGLLSAAMLVLAGLAFLNSGMAWVYIAAFMLFEFWMVRAMAAVGKAPVAVDQPPYHFTETEAELVRRYRFYFTWPSRAHQAAAVLAALGLSALVLAPWLTFRQAFLPAIVIGVNLFAVARLTKAVAPVMALRVAASRADREALRLLEAHDPAWSKIRSGNQPSTQHREMQ